MKISNYNPNFSVHFKTHQQPQCSH